MTTIHFSGAEVAAHRKLLLGEGVESMALNLSAYFAQRQAVQLKDTYDGLPMVLYATEGGLDPNKVEAFLAINAEAFTMIYGLRCDHPLYVPEWSGGDINAFYALAEPLQRVGVSEGVATDPELMRGIASFCRRQEISLVTTSSKSAALAHRWDELILGAWVASAKHRELQVWDGHTVRRYSRAAKPAAIDKHRGQIIALAGPEAPQALADDVTEELMLVSIRSWLIYATRSAQVVAIVPQLDQDETAPAAVARVAIQPRERARVPLPVLREVTYAAEPGEVPTTGIEVNKSLLRSCDSCNLSQMCPQYDPGSRCAFNMPMTIQTKQDIRAAQAALLEIQLARITMSRFAEDLLSQGLDPTLSQEMERFFRMVEAVKRSDQVVEQIQITATSESGAISRLFGDAAGRANTQLAAPVSANELSEIVYDAEMVDEPTDT